MRKFEITFDENKNYEQYQAILKLAEYWSRPHEKPNVSVNYNGQDYKLESVEIKAVD